VPGTVVEVEGSNRRRRYYIEAICEVMKCRSKWGSCNNLEDCKNAEVLATFPTREKYNKVKSRACNVSEGIWGGCGRRRWYSNITRTHAAKTGCRKVWDLSIPEVRDGQASHTPDRGRSMVANKRPQSRGASDLRGRHLSFGF